eukprot:sb/3462233/
MHKILSGSDAEYSRLLMDFAALCFPSHPTPSAAILFRGVCSTPELREHTLTLWRNECLKEYSTLEERLRALLSLYSPPAEEVFLRAVSTICAGCYPDLSRPVFLKPLSHSTVTATQALQQFSLTQEVGGSHSLLLSKRGTGTQTIRENMKRKRKEAQAARRRTLLKMVRNYRVGELPDIEISFHDLVGPLVSVSSLSDAMASVTLLSLVTHHDKLDCKDALLSIIRTTNSNTLGRVCADLSLKCGYVHPDLSGLCLKHGTINLASLAAEDALAAGCGSWEALGEVYRAASDYNSLLAIATHHQEHSSQDTLTGLRLLAERDYERALECLQGGSSRLSEHVVECLVNLGRWPAEQQQEDRGDLLFGATPASRVSKTTGWAGIDIRHGRLLMDFAALCFPSHPTPSAAILFRGVCSTPDLREHTLTLWRNDCLKEYSTLEERLRALLSLYSPPAEEVFLRAVSTICAGCYPDLSRPVFLKPLSHSTVTATQALQQFSLTQEVGGSHSLLLSKRGTGTQTIRENMKRKRKEAQAARRRTLLKMVRNYRVGELPDIEISFHDLVGPLVSVSSLSDAMASVTLLSLVTHHDKLDCKDALLSIIRTTNSNTLGRVCADLSLKCGYVHPDLSGLCLKHGTINLASLAAEDALAAGCGSWEALGEVYRAASDYNSLLAIATHHQEHSSQDTLTGLRLLAERDYERALECLQGGSSRLSEHVVECLVNLGRWPAEQQQEDRGDLLFGATPASRVSKTTGWAGIGKGMGIGNGFNRRPRDMLFVVNYIGHALATKIGPVL